MNTNQTGIAKIKPKDIIEYKEVAVITTRQLADFYGTGTGNIRRNFNRNQEWFIEGESYFRLEGKELETFRLSETKRDAQIEERGRSKNLPGKRRKNRRFFG